MLLTVGGAAHRSPSTDGGNAVSTEALPTFQIDKSINPKSDLRGWKGFRFFDIVGLMKGHVDGGWPAAVGVEAMVSR